MDADPEKEISKTVTVLGDMAARVASELSVEADASLAEGAALSDPLADEKSHILTKIRFAWRPTDQEILQRIRAASDATFLELFAEAITVIDDFYATMRVPEAQGPDGRPLWKIDEQTGRPAEDLSQLTGQDVDKAILDLQRILMSVSTEVNHLMLEAVAAHHIAKDIYDDSWGSVIEGTQGDRTARSNRAARVDRWHAHFRFCLYSTAKTFLDEINAFLKRLDNIAYREMRRS